MAGHIVTAPLVIARDEQGKDVYLYQNVQVPSGIPAAEIKRLIEGDFISKGTDPVSTEPAPDPGVPAPVVSSKK